MSDFNAVLAQYEKSKQTTSGNQNKVSNEDRLKKYFACVLPKGVKNEERRIRILPTKDGSSPFIEVDFHEVQVDGKWVKIYDPKQEGKRSPLTEVAEGLAMTGDPADKVLSKNYKPRKFYIVKVIDRDNEQDGAKFWRFKYAYKGDGIFDKIVPIYKNKKNIDDPELGRDLILSLGLAKSNAGKDYTIITSIIPDDISPLNTDKVISDSWVSDELVWSDVYAKRSEEYLVLVANGEVPKWSKESNKWVSSEAMGEETIGSNTSNETSTTTPIVDPQENDEPTEDLPF